MNNTVNTCYVDVVDESLFFAIYTIVYLVWASNDLQLNVCGLQQDITAFCQHTSYGVYI